MNLYKGLCQNIMPYRFSSSSITSADCQEHIRNILRVLDCHKDGLVPASTMVRLIMNKKYKSCNTPQLQSIREEFDHRMSKDVLDKILKYEGDDFHEKIASRFFMAQPYMSHYLAKDLTFPGYILHKIKLI